MNTATATPAVRSTPTPIMEIIMTKVLLALGAAAVALGATPAMAQRHDNNGNRHNGRACAQWRHSNCVRWDNRGYRMSNARHARWNAGYHFGPSYGYTSYNSLPRTYVSRYSLR